MFFSTAILLAVIVASPIWAHQNTAECGIGFDWNRNTFGQDPCVVGSILDASCRGLKYTYPPLTDATQYYLPPMANHPGDMMCDCNTVMYSLYMACAWCQGGQIYSWIKWVQQCASVDISRYPANIPHGTAVPRWAYYDITSLPNRTWNESVAFNIGRYPEELLKRIATVPVIPDTDTDSPTIANHNTQGPGTSTSVLIPAGLSEPTIPISSINVQQPSDPVENTSIQQQQQPSDPTINTSVQGPTSITDNTNLQQPTNPADDPDGSANSSTDAGEPTTPVVTITQGPSNPTGRNANLPQPKSGSNTKVGLSVWAIPVIIFLSWTLI